VVPFANKREMVVCFGGNGMLRQLAVCLVCFGTGLFTLLSTGSSAADPNDTGSAVTAQEAEDMVKLHNKARAEVGVAALKWSPTLAKYAQEWADELARSRCEMQPVHREE
jgi:pathogenesis-related protein 1